MDSRFGPWQSHLHTPLSASLSLQYLNGMRHNGTLVTANGTVYQGHFDNDKKHGKGLMRFPDGSVYEGDFRDNQRAGKGRFVNTRACTFFEGEFRANRRHGSGARRHMCVWR